MDGSAAPPGARPLLVDGMNVIGARPDGWWRDRPGAIRRLVAGLQALAAEPEGEPDLIVVLDGRPLPDLPEGEKDGVRVTYARRRGRDAADDRIVELVAELAVADGVEVVRVVTSDRGLQARVHERGAAIVSVRKLRDRLDAGS